MSSTTDGRNLWRTWSPAFETAPPAACQTLRNYNNTVQYGYSCVFREEKEDPTPFAINTLCMPWVTPNVYPGPGVFYSPATACPSSWSPVSTASSGEQWVGGERVLTCCPAGFEGDGRGGCRVSSSGSHPVVQCGDADADENRNRIYSAGRWPATVTPNITALQLRYQASDLGSASMTATGASSPSSSASGGGLSIGAKAAIGTIVPLIALLGALAFLLFRRRRKQKNSAIAKSTSHDDGKKPSLPAAASSSPPYHPSPSPGLAKSAAAHTAHRGTNPHETPEWNAELDATEAERQGLVPNSAVSNTASNTSELGGLARMPRKPIAPVEIDGTPVLPELGDAYIPYRPGR